ncbi:MAG: acyltransferase family protein [Carboxylicivirga sp.]|jgi:fucose 4-O-acetylase-like acetyltransferase|nr:acyltransferase family protein [Carboxylicivirga sp.]
MSVLKDRIEWLDTAKGIGIIIVVYGHLEFNLAHYYFESFIMPFFIFASGFSSRVDLKESFFIYAKKNFKKLMFPYYFWGTLLYIFWVIFDSLQYDTLLNFVGLFFAYGGKEYMNWGVVLWFLPALYIAKLIHYIIIRTSAIILLGFLVAGFWLGKQELVLPYSIHSSLVLIVFYHLGYLLNYKKSNVRFKLFALILTSTLWLVIIQINGPVTVYMGEYGNNPISFISGAILGIFLLVIISQIVLRMPIIKLLGRNTLLIYILHLRAITFVKIVQLYILGIPIRNSIISSLLYTVISIFICLSTSILLKKYSSLFIDWKYAKYFV